MRNCGRHIVLLVLASTLLAACGGGSDGASFGGAGNLPPIISGTPVLTLNAGSPYSFTPSVADPDGDALTFSITNKPTWASFNNNNGALTGTPTEANVGMSGMITIEVSDSKASTQLAPFQIQVVSSANPPPGGNSAPTIAGTPPTSATVGRAFTFTPVGDDADDDTLTFSIDNKPTWATFTPATGQLSGTPAAGDVGTTTGIVIRVSDGTANAALPAFDLQVVATPPANRPPTITGTPRTSITVGTAYSFRPVASDPDGNTLLFSIQGQPGWATFSATTGRLSGTPGTANVGASARITISVSDGTTTVSLPSFTIQVNASANRSPTISGTPDTSVTVGTPYSFQPSAADADGNTLTFSIANKPAWLTFTNTNGRLSGTPAAADVANYPNITITVSDGTAQASLPAFAINVVQTASGSATLNWQVPTQYADGTPMGDLAGYRIAYGRAANSMTQSAQVSNASLTTYTVGQLASGTWYFSLYAYTSAGAESESSPVLSKVIP